MNEIQEYTEGIMDQVKQTMFDLDDVIRLCLVALYCQGHVLLEGNPGLGKTELVKSLGKALYLDFGRIQFTPDLMPADITGTYMPDFTDLTSQAWTFKKGPIFTSLLLADEINRATPKTQSAMLEAMAERQVTVLGTRHEMPTSFMVLATQNPIEHEGTYNLPEAQADRFMFKIRVPVPGGSTLQRIVGKQAGRLSGEPEAAFRDRWRARAERTMPSIKEAQRQEGAARLGRFFEAITAVDPLPEIEVHIHNLFMASNKRLDKLQGVDGPAREHLGDLADLMSYGLGPRAAFYLMLGVKAWSIMFRSEGQQGDQANQLAALAHVLVPTLRHRLILTFGWEQHYWKLLNGKKAAPPEEVPTNFVDQFLADLAVSAFPAANQIQRDMKVRFRAKIEQANL